MKYFNRILGVAQIVSVILVLCANSALKHDGQTITLILGKPDERPVVSPELANWLISDKVLRHERQSAAPVPKHMAARG